MSKLWPEPGEFRQAGALIGGWQQLAMARESAETQLVKEHHYGLSSQAMCSGRVGALRPGQTLASPSPRGTVQSV